MNKRLSPEALEDLRLESTLQAVLDAGRWLPAAADRLFDKGWPVELALAYAERLGATEDLAVAERGAAIDQAAQAAAYREMDAHQRQSNRLHMERD